MNAISTRAAPGAAGYNLWAEPWIGVVRPDGRVEQLGIGACLEQAHLLAGLYDPSPLVVAGIHRLLAAILQFMYAPAGLDDVRTCLKRGCFIRSSLTNFQDEYGDRFDLFSVEQPFLQTNDVPPVWRKGDIEAKSVGYLFPEEPTATNVVHFRHRYDDGHQFCPACAAAGLVTIPAFATSGGAGIKPSINGVPPLYVLPSGPTLFRSLALSLLAPAYLPSDEWGDDDDMPWWLSDNRVPRAGRVQSVGYVQGLTFPARRVRLYPSDRVGTCSRCGRSGSSFVRTMLFEMGLERPKDAPFWRDPFAAYTQKQPKPPVPVRPREGRDTWREFGSLFLANTFSRGSKETQYLRPQVVGEIQELLAEGDIPVEQQLTFRCIGLRTDMKAKVFEWVDSALEMAPGLLADDVAADSVRRGLQHAEDWLRDLVGIARRVYGDMPSRWEPLRRRLEAAYWRELAAPFRDFVTRRPEDGAVQDALTIWTRQVLDLGEHLFNVSLDEMGDRGEDLRLAAQARLRCRLAAAKRKEWFR